MAGEAPAATSPAGCNITNSSNISSSNSNSNSKESSPDPVQQQLNSSVDSGIAVLEAETPTLRRRQRLHQCQRILQVLQRDHLTHQQLRDRLSKLANKKWKKEETSEDRHCNVCCADLDLSSGKNYVTCCTCGKSVCRGPKCADWRPKDAKWECQLCQSSKESLAHTSSWVAEQMSFNQHKFVYPMRARSEVYIPIVGDGNDSSMQFESVSQIGQTASMDERAKIREYVEEIVAEMLGGNLDHIKVGQLSKSENYLPAIVNGHNSNNNNNNNNNADTELADISQTRLRSLIETIIAETLRSSSLSASGAVSEISLDTRSHASELANGNGLKRRHRTEHYFEPKIYQDLLATAVLNKIADKEGNTRLLAESTPDLSVRHIDENFNAEALSTTSGSSIEPRSDCSLTDHEIGLDNGKSKSLQADLERESVLSDYIAAHMVPLPDFSASVTESEDDIGSISSGVIGEGNWEDNWLFKKKRSSATPSSTGMLVPAPKENVRAQIGDKTTDEVSDLSEMGSDIEESSLDLLRCNDLNDRLLSKHLIGGQNTKMVLDELVDRTSLTSHTLLEEHESAFTETTNEFVVSPMAVPADIKAPPRTPPPPPMIFQDDLLNDEPDHTPIAAQPETEELDSLDGCTGFSTVEYIDEEQMHETVPSVIEILAAMALGPMLAVPASEQPGAMTPSEMHTLKELSDLALAEINSRTVDLVRLHSLDIIEEEYAEPSEAIFDIVQPPPLAGIPTSDEISSEEQESVIQMEILPPPLTIEVVPEFDTTSVEPPPPMEVDQETESVNMDPPVTPETELVKVEPVESVVVDPPSSEQVSNEDCFAVNQTEPVELVGEAISVAVDIPAPLEIVTETILDPEVVLQINAIDVEPPEHNVMVPETGSSTLENISETHPIVVQLPPPLEISTAKEPVSMVVPDSQSPETIETISVDCPTSLDNFSTSLEEVSKTKSCESELPTPLEIVPETQLEAVIPALETQNVPQIISELLDIIPEPKLAELSEPAEIVSQTVCGDVNPVESAGSLPETPPLLLDLPAPIEVVPKQQSNEVDPPETIEDLRQVASVNVEMIIEPVTEAGEPKTLCGGMDSLQSAETQSFVVNIPAPIGVVPEQQSNIVDSPETVANVPQIASVPAEITPELVAAELSESVEIVSETGCSEVDPPESSETISISQPIVVDLPAPIEIVPEQQSNVVDPPETKEDVSQISSVPVQIILEPIAKELPRPNDIILQTVRSEMTLAESDPLTETITVIPPEPLEGISEAQPENVTVVSQGECKDEESSSLLEITPTNIVSSPIEFATTVVVQETSSVEVDTLVTEEHIPQTEFVEVVYQTESLAVEPPATVEIISGEQVVDETLPLPPGPESFAENAPKSEEVVTEAHSGGPPVEIICESKGSTVEPIPPVKETVSETAPLVSDSVNVSVPLENIPEIHTSAEEEQTIALDPPPLLEVVLQGESVNEMDLQTSESTKMPPAHEDKDSHAESESVVLSTPPTSGNDPRTQPTSDPSTLQEKQAPTMDYPVPLEFVSQPLSVAVDHLATIVNILQIESEYVVAQAETLAIETAVPAKSILAEISPTETILPASEYVEANAPKPENSLTEAASPAMEPVAPVEAPVEALQETEPIAIDSPIPIEDVIQLDSVVVETIAPEVAKAESVEVFQPSTAEVYLETPVEDQLAAGKQEEPASIVQDIQIALVEPSAPIDLEDNAVAMNSPTPVENLSTDTEVFLPLPVEIDQETDSTSVEPSASTEISLETVELVLEAQLIAADTTTAVEVIREDVPVSENQPTDDGLVSVNTPDSENVPINQEAVPPPEETVKTIAPLESPLEEKSHAVDTTASDEIALEEVAPEPLSEKEVDPQTAQVAVNEPEVEQNVDEIGAQADFIAVDPPPSVEIVIKAESAESSKINETDFVEVLVSAEILSETQCLAGHSPECCPPALVEAVLEKEPPECVEIVPQIQFVAVDLSEPLKVIAEADSAEVKPPTPMEDVPETEIPFVAIVPEAQEASVEVDPIDQPVSEDQSANAEELNKTNMDVVDSSESLKIVLEEESLAVETPKEHTPETESVASPVSQAEASATKITEFAENGSDIMDIPMVSESIPQTQSPAEDIPRAVEDVEQDEFVSEEPSESAQIVPQAESMDPSHSMKVDSERKLEQPAPVDIVPETQAVTMETDPKAEAAPIEPSVPTENVTQAAEVVPEKKSDNVEVVPETQSIAEDSSELIIDAAPQKPIEIVAEAETPAVENHPENIEVDHSDSLKIAPQPESVAEEMMPEAVTTAVETAETLEPQTLAEAMDSVAVDLVPETSPAPRSIETQSVDLEPLALVKTISETESATVDSPAPAQVHLQPELIETGLSSNMKIISEPQPPTTVEVVLKSADVEPTALVETISETGSVATDTTKGVDVKLETALKPQSPSAEPPVPMNVEIVPELQPLAARPQEHEHVDQPAPVEIVPEIQSIAEETIVPAESDVETQGAVGVSSELLPDAESVPALCVDNLEEMKTDAKEAPPSGEPISKHTMDCIAEAKPLMPEALDQELESKTEIPTDMSPVNPTEEAPPSAEPTSKHTMDCIAEAKPLTSEELDRELESNTEIPTDLSPVNATAEGIQKSDTIDSTKSDSSALGSIAEREVKKWYNAVEMPNNPYAPEALKQRISGTQERYMDVPNISPSAEQKALASALTENPEPSSPKTDYKRYSRDYYINNAPTTDNTGSVKTSSSIPDPQRAAEDAEDIVINEAQKASEPATEQDPSQDSVYKALPVQVLDESLDSQSNPSLYSLQTTTTTTSDESDTVRIYDFNKQETTVIKAAREEQQPSTSTTSSMESAQSAPPSVSSFDSSSSKKRERPVVLQFGPGDSAPTIGSPAGTPTRGSTPPAFRFLQPKRRLIDPSQVLSVDEDDVPEPSTPAAEKPVIEDEVAHSMPSVKALAQAFLLTSKHTQPQRRWRASVRIAAPPDTPDKPTSSLAKRHKLEHAVSMAEVADESTIASDLSSLETDPSIHSESNPPIASPASPVPVRHGFLRSNIAFFENLKFK
ncbi:titin homolog isoform X2 [Drosophila rhopaloa]|uniref:Titin homolog n=1 Tax=Drosophila rhopaloa TaxID=1041015 RepID=A0ABM5JEA1_DRORH|nr:titin homolog isoform X2 [Drosophila rhopaloa]